MPSLPQSAPPAGARWLSLGGACSLLGVNPATLRHWADTGRLRTFRTPGGHRRFAEEDLLGIIARGQPRFPSAAIDEREASLQRALSRIHRRVGASSTPAAQWSERVPAAERSQLRELGRRLVELAFMYAARPRRRSALGLEAHGIGTEYGAILARCGVPLSGLLEGFIFFRNLVEESARSQARSGSEPGRTVELQRHLSGLLDRVLLGAVQGYESVRIGVAEP